MKYNFPQTSEQEKTDWGNSLDQRRAPKKHLMILALFVLLAAVSFALMRSNPTGPQENRDAVADTRGGMKKFASYEELNAFLAAEKGNADNASNGLQRGNFGLKQMAGRATNGIVELDYAPTAFPEAAPATAGTDHSATNIQVAGVDEDDIVKTDGQYVYALHEQSVLVFAAQPAAETALVATIALDYAPSGLYLLEDKLAVFGTRYNFQPAAEEKIPAERSKLFSSFSIYDLTDRRNPLKVKEYDFEGSFRSSRLIGDYVYFITATEPVYAFYKERPLPYLLEDGAVRKDAAMPAVYYFDIDYTNRNLTSVSAIDLRDPEAAVTTETYVLDGNQNALYVSPRNIYITFSQYMSEQRLTLAVIRDFVLEKISAEDAGKVREIEGVADYVLDEEEKAGKVMDIFAAHLAALAPAERERLQEELKGIVNERAREIAGEMQKTVVHKIAIEKGSLTYQAAGEVPGQVLNQYAMDEDADGSFRIATTVNAAWINYGGEALKSYNNLFVLDAGLQRAGALEDIAPGETIQAARFVNDRAYLVTFERTDPLFVIDLGTNEPRILGELKVPGYSTYLHPYGDDLFIGLGRNADADGREIEGIKLSLFDASDVTAPREVNTYILGGFGSSSAALYDAKAFLFSREKNLLAIPATVRKEKRENRYDGTVTDAGTAVFRVDETGFELKGIVDHRTSDEKKSEYGATETRRNLYIGDNLYSFSDNFLKVNALSDLSKVQEIRLPAAVPLPTPMAETGGASSGPVKSR